MAEFQRLLDDFMGNPSGEQECLNLVDYFRTLARYRMDDRDLEDIQGKLRLLQPRDAAEAEHISAVDRAAAEYRGRNHSPIGSITRVLNTVTRDFTGVYSEEDFEAQLAKIRAASEQGGSNAERLVQVNRLYEMIGAYNADPLFTKKIGADEDDIRLLNQDLYRRVEFPAGSPQEGYYRVEGAGMRTPREWRAFDSFYERIIQAAAVPDAEEMKTMLLRYILQEYQNYPTPSRRILQIVNYMTGKTALFREDHWEEDSLRLRILKQFIKYGNCMMYHPEDSSGPVYIMAGRPAILEYIQKRYEEEGRQVAQKDITNQMILDKIDDHIFDVLEEEEIRRIIPLAVEQIQSEGREFTYETIDQYAGQCGCCGIRDEVIRYYLKRVRKKFPGTAHFPAEGFRYIHEVYKDNVKPKGTWEILRAADDLAAGRFGENTKRYLYLFALVFGMTYRNPDSSDSEFTDVDINLFQKLYVDEPQRYLIPEEREEQDGRKRNRKDLPPSGQGINRKDFRELICLYFIRKPFRTQDDLVRKVVDCDKMIRRVEKPVIAPGICRGDLTRMITGKGGAAQQLCSSARKSSRMPEREFEEFLQENYHLIPPEDPGEADIIPYENSSKPDPWMEHLVNTLAGNNPEFRADAWEGDTLRLRILKQFIKYGNFMTYKEGGIEVSILSGKESILQYAGQESSREMSMDEVISALQDDIFDLPDEIMVREELERAFFAVLDGLKGELYFKIKGVTADAVFREIRHPACRVVCDCLLVESARSRIMERMRQRGDLTAEDVWRVLREIVSEKYQNELIPENRYEILIAANALAAGQVTRQNQRYLYLFAMAYDMTCHSGIEQGIDWDTDAEWQLFHEYVSHSGQVFYGGKSRNFNMENPAVNYSNFTEAIYLYYLGRTGSPERKLRESDRMIRRLCGPGREHRHSKEYRNWEEQAFSFLSEREFEKYLRRNYDCGAAGRNLTEIQAQQNSAYREYQFYMIVLYGLLIEGGIDVLDLSNLRERPDLLDRRYQDILDFSVRRKEWMPPEARRLEIGKGLGWYERLTVDQMDDSRNRQTVDRSWEENEFEIFEGQITPEQLNQAGKIIHRADKMIGSCFPLIRKPEKMSRNALLGAYYYDYILWNVEVRNTTETDYPEIPMGFMGVYEDFGKGNRTDRGWRHVWKGADAVLEAAGYQALSTKNLLDVLVVFSIYEKYAML